MPLGDNRFFVSGGFGCSQNKHQRLRDGVVIDLGKGRQCSEVHAFTGLHVPSERNFYHYNFHLVFCR